MWLLFMAIVGFVVGNGLFVYWLFNEYQGFAAIWSNRLALAFIIDAFLTLIVLTVHFAHQPPGRVRWPWFVVFSIVGGLCFGLPFYWWLNRPASTRPGTTT
jgi:hypothetical protein